MFLFAITDIDTQQNLQSFFGRTKITRLQKGANPKAKPDAQEVEIELIDDNVIKMLEVGHHITYLPKEKGTLYVGYTKYPNVPKTQEGYIRQGRDVEDDFILFKQGLLVPKKKEQHKEKRGGVPPEVLYLAVEEKYVEDALKTNVSAAEGNFLQLSKSTSKALALESDKENLHLIKIDSAQMYQNGIRFEKDVDGEWFVQIIDAKYMTLLI